MLSSARLRPRCGRFFLSITRIRLNVSGYRYQSPRWWVRLREDDAFTSLPRCQWEELRVAALSDEAFLERMSYLVAEVAETEVRDNGRWGNVGVWIDP